MTCNCVVYSKMKPIGFDELFNRKAFNNKLDSTLSVKEPTDEHVVEDNIK